MIALVVVVVPFGIVVAYDCHVSLCLDCHISVQNIPCSDSKHESFWMMNIISILVLLMIVYELS
jgi:hypothetical protein